MRWSRRAALVAGLATVLPAKVVAAASAANPFITNAVPGGRTLVSGCVIRFLPKDDGRPSLHANGAHLSAGVRSVGITQHGDVIAHQTITDPVRFPVLFAFIQPDEQFVTRGIIGGASGGTDTTRFWLYDTTIGRKLDLTQRSDRHRIMGETANVWAGWIHVDGR